MTLNRSFLTMIVLIIGLGQYSHAQIPLSSVNIDVANIYTQAGTVVQTTTANNTAIPGLASISDSYPTLMNPMGTAESFGDSGAFIINAANAFPFDNSLCNDGPGRVDPNDDSTVVVDPGGIIGILADLAAVAANAWCMTN